ICLTDTDGPFWNAFNDGTSENCPDSSETFFAVACDETRQFVIQVRRPSCGNGVVEDGEACDDGNQETSDGCTPECTVYDGTARDCLEVLQGSPTSPSGTYLIDPDGAEGQDPYPVWCDMEADGGGWTRIYVADKNNLQSKELDYTITDPLLRTTRASVMLGYTTPQGGPVHGRATLAMPESWVVQAPMRYPNQDDTVTVQVEGGAPQESTLRYGWGGFSASCAHGWNGAVTGRICLQGTEGPYWGGFAYFNTGVDWCESSAKNYNSGAWCDTDTRFAIYVRRAVCGDGVVEGDEPCDDQNPSEMDGCTSSCATYADATDCVDVLEQAPGSPSGVYLIDPDGPEGKGPISVYCDMETDGGGWTALINPLNHGQDYMEQFPSTENTVTDYVVDPDKGVSWGTNQVDDLDEIVSSLTVTVPFDEVRIVHSGDYVGGIGRLELLNETDSFFISTDSWSTDAYGQSLIINGVDIHQKDEVVFEDREDTASAPGSAELRIGMTGLLGYDYTRRYVKALWFRRASCGNGVVEAGETCDDANGDNT
ncbi:MAG: fibrinogen-like YCDxxxxGGGW domain-containing protein, partial [Myxococcota bacterium]|nr:fibrinogen-like YCDxxxxGGGW domain-containing protein [Myxococcota bacterium]